jgi:hypothetical protein
MTGVRKCICFALSVILCIFAFCSCGQGASGDSVSDFFAALRTLNTSAMAKSVVGDRVQSIVDPLEDGDAKTLNLLKDVYLHFSFTADVAEKDDGAAFSLETRIVSGKVSYLDIGRLMSLVESEEKVSSSIRADIVASVLEKNAAMLLSQAQIEIKTVKDNGLYKISFEGSDNSALLGIIRTDAFVKWLNK